MTPQEFEERTGLTPTTEEFNYVHSVYMNTSMDKDEFCKDYKKHGASKIISDMHARAVNFELMEKQKDERIDETVAFLIGKSRAYNDTDFRKMAVRLVGEHQVVLKTVASGMPLWEEDIEYIKRNLNNGI